MNVGETIENYLETILILLQKKGSIRSIDIVNEMGYSKPTISIMMKQLRENGYIKMNNRGFISLTDEGLKIARRTYERHNLLAEILIALGVNKETAYQDACKIEHDLSKESFAKIKDYYLKCKTENKQGKD